MIQIEAQLFEHCGTLWMDEKGEKFQNQQGTQNQQK